MADIKKIYGNPICDEDARSRITTIEDKENSYYTKTEADNLLENKVTNPTTAGTAGQVLKLDSELNPVWGNDNVFVAKYDAWDTGEITNSTYEEVKSAYDAGKTIFVFDGYAYLPMSDSGFLFSGVWADSDGFLIYSYNLTEEDGWGTLSDGSLAYPVTAGTAGQVLKVNDYLRPVWADESGGVVYANDSYQTTVSVSKSTQSELYEELMNAFKNGTTIRARIANSTYGDRILTAVSFRESDDGFSTAFCSDGSVSGYISIVD